MSTHDNIGGFKNRREFNRYWRFELERFKQEYRDRKGYKRNARNFKNSPEFFEWQRRKNISLTALKKSNKRNLFSTYFQNPSLQNLPPNKSVSASIPYALIQANYGKHIFEIRQYLVFEDDALIMIRVKYLDGTVETDLYASEFSVISRLMELVNEAIVNIDESYLFSNSFYVVDVSTNKQEILFIDVVELQK